MTGRALVILLFLFATTSSAQEPQLLGIIPSDTINSLFGTEIVPLGDQNGDGRDDILIWDFRLEGRLYLGGHEVDTVTSLVIEDLFRIWRDAVDVNGDQYLDFLAETVDGQPDRIRTLFGGPGLDTITDFFFGVDSLLGSLSHVISIDDINNNGLDEVVAQEFSFAARRIVMYEISSPLDSVPDIVFGPPPLDTIYFGFGENLATGDFNGDGSPDLVTNWRKSEDTVSGAALIYYGGDDFDTIPDLVIRRPPVGGFARNQFAYGILLSPGDLSGDGWDDLVISSSYAFDDTLTFVYFGGPSIDSIPDVIIQERIDVAAPAGDVNDDGYSDLLTGFSLPLGGFVSLYYGGPDFDSLHDFRVWDSDLPGLHFEVGREVAGIGDYNGDGTDDFAFAGISGQRGQVYIYNGFQDPTDVPFDYEPILPTGYELSQNYPNPFNPSTTIQFALPKAGETELVVYNILGERVTTLIDRRLAAGSYTLEWDGTNAQGESVASGVYVYRLQSGDYTTSRKMVLAR